MNQHIKKVQSRLGIKQWAPTGGYDEDDSCETQCQLCDKEGLKYLFEIAPVDRSEAPLWVGSQCILSFEAILNGLSKKEKNKHIKKIVKSHKAKKFNDYLDSITTGTKPEYIKSIARAAREGKITIAQAIYLAKETPAEFYPNIIKLKKFSAKSATRAINKAKDKDKFHSLICNLYGDRYCAQYYSSFEYSR